MNVLVLDAGSSALKATLFDEDGAVIAGAEAAYPEAIVPHRRAPEDWWQASIVAVRSLGSHGVGAIALTGTMENLIALDGDGRPAMDAVLYTDPCGTATLGETSDRLSAIGATAILGNAPEPLMTAFKLGWLRATEPERFARTRTVLPGSKDYLAFRLTGQLVTDAATATTTGLMDIFTRRWSAEMLALFDLDPGLLPPILPSDAVVGGLTAEAAAALGLNAGIAVINGCGDGAATTIGAGAERADEISVYLGTSGWVAGVTGTTDRGVRPYYRLAHPLTNGLIEIAPILAAGAATRWARDALGLDLDRAELLALEADRAPGKVLFLPYLDGERSPFLDLDLRAGFAGVSATDGAAALYYAVLEGVACAIAANVSAMGATGRVFLVGGGAQSAVWPQIVADVLGREVVVPGAPVLASSLGAFRIAAQALGFSMSAVGGGTSYRPRAERAARMARQAKRFAAATRMLRELARLG